MSDTITVSRVGLWLRVFGVIFGLIAVGFIASPTLEDPRFVQAEPEKYARMALFGKVALPLCLLAVVIRVQWVLHGGGITRRVGLVVPMVRQSVRLPTDPRVVCRKHRGRGNSGAVYVSYPVLIEGHGTHRALVVKRFGRDEEAEADAFADAVGALLGLPREPGVGAPL